MLLSGLLSLLTLGIYSFWAKVRKRRYMVSHHLLQDTPFEYTGSGKELFTGFLKSMVVLGPLIAGMALTGEAHPILNLLFLFCFFCIAPLAIYMSLRYRLNHLRWRGIRFGLEGSAIDYTKLCIKEYLINIVTIGILAPRSSIKKWAFKANNMRFGTQPFKFEAKKANIKMLVKMNVLNVLFGFFGFALLVIFPPLGAAALLGVLIHRFNYYAALWQEKWRCMSLGNLRFKSTATGGDYLKLIFTNLLIVIFSLGLMFPLVAIRMAAFRARHLKIGGDLNMMAAQQAKTIKTSATGDMLDMGESLGAALDFGL